MAQFGQARAASEASQSSTNDGDLHYVDPVIADGERGASRLWTACQRRVARIRWKTLTLSTAADQRNWSTGAELTRL